LAKRVKKTKVRPEVSGIDPQTKKSFECESCGEVLSKGGKAIEGAHIEEYYDPFSDDPKGYAALCEKHEEFIHESYFTCDDCGRLVVNNYTWEMYSVNDPVTGAMVCSRCAAKRFFGGVGEWHRVGEAANLDFEEIRKAPHATCVGLDIHKLGLPYTFTKVDSVTLDSMSGGLVTGFSSSSSREDGVRTLNQMIRAAAKNHPDAEYAVVLDGAFQFAVEIGVYIRYPKVRRKKSA